VASGQITFDVTATFTMKYDGDYSGTTAPLCCIGDSRAEINDFHVTGVGEIDQKILDKVRDDMLFQLDSRLASDLNKLPLSCASGRPLADGDNPRCDFWHPLSH
jgi:hypothetical protein